MEKKTKRFLKYHGERLDVQLNWKKIDRWSGELVRMGMETNSVWVRGGRDGKNWTKLAAYRLEGTQLKTPHFLGSED